MMYSRMIGSVVGYAVASGVYGRIVAVIIY